LVAVV